MISEGVREVRKKSPLVLESEIYLEATLINEFL